MDRINRYSIGDKVVFLGNIATVKDYIFHALEHRCEYVIKVADNKPEIVQENEIHKHSELLPIGIQEYLKIVLKPYPYNSYTDFAWKVKNRIYIHINDIGEIILPIKEESLSKIETYVNYKLEDLGL